ncbi:MAG TPA: hypothetical protein VGJ44_23240 [Kribbellaceae bacterium]
MYRIATSAATLVPRQEALVRSAVVQAFAGKADEESDAAHRATTTTPPASVWGADKRAERFLTRHWRGALTAQRS